MCQQMSLIEHPLSTMSLSRSISENIPRNNDRLPSVKSDCNRYLNQRICTKLSLGDIETCSIKSIGVRKNNTFF